MAELLWLNDNEFELRGVRFECGLRDYSLTSDEDRLVILKDGGTLDQYISALSDIQPRNMLEFGIFQGGSPAFFALWFDLQKFVGIDICAPVSGFERFRRTREIGERIAAYYGVSQTNRERIEEIVNTEFAANPIDVIIDDASHAYGATKRTFEIAFPFLRPGGVYVIEDWGWAHWPTSRLYQGQTALSMLVMELLMACASRGDIISELRVFPAFAFVRKSTAAPPLATLRLDELYTKRGIELIGPRNMKFADTARVWGEGLAGSALRALRRAARKFAPRDR